MMEARVSDVTKQLQSDVVMNSDVFFCDIYIL